MLVVSTPHERCVLPQQFPQWRWLSWEVQDVPGQEREQSEATLDISCSLAWLSISHCWTRAPPAVLSALADSGSGRVLFPFFPWQLCRLRCRHSQGCQQWSCPYAAEICLGCTGQMVDAGSSTGQMGNGRWSALDCPLTGVLTSIRLLHPTWRSILLQRMQGSTHPGLGLCVGTVLRHCWAFWGPGTAGWNHLYWRLLSLNCTSLWGARPYGWFRVLFAMSSSSALILYLKSTPTKWTVESLDFWSNFEFRDFHTFWKYGFHYICCEILYSNS